MSKDKAGKKDKLKNLDLFAMMFDQSQVFRDMVEHFQSTKTSRTPSVEIEEGVATRSPVTKQPKAAKAAPVATSTKKRVARKSVASAKPAPAVTQESPKSAGNVKAAPSQPKPATPDKATTAGRVAKKK